MAGFGEVNSVDFAIYLQQAAIKRGLEVNMTKVQKWLYICYGFYLAIHNRQLLDEKPIALHFGPLFENVYKEQKRNNDSLIGLEARIVGVDFSVYNRIIDATLKLFGDWSAGELVYWTHKDGGAWQKQIKTQGKRTAMDNFEILLDFKELFPDEEN